MSGGFCPNHGPYDGPVCPYCSGGYAAGGRPQEPMPLGADEAPTDMYGGRGGGGGGGQMDDEAETMVGAGRRTPGRRPLDVDEESETMLGKAHKEADYTELEVTEHGVMGILWVKEGPRRGSIYKIKHNTVIGRKEGNLILEDPKVSNPHAKFTLEGEQFTIWDFGSSNGTYVKPVGGEKLDKIRQATPLNENDEIKIGESVFVLKVLL
jgi:hypothetical protein